MDESPPLLSEFRSTNTCGCKDFVSQYELTLNKRITSPQLFFTNAAFCSTLTVNNNKKPDADTTFPWRRHFYYIILGNLICYFYEESIDGAENPVHPAKNFLT